MIKKSLLATLLACAMIFAGCGGAGNTQSSSQAQSPAQASASESGSEPAQSGPTKTEVLRIGNCDAFTGAGAVYGLPQKEAIEMAVEEINNAGGIVAGDTAYMIELVSYDNKSDPNEGVAALRKLIDRDGVKIVLGWANSGVAMAAANVVGDEDVLMLVGTAGEESITTLGNENILRTRPPAGYTGGPAGKFVASKGVEKLGVIGQLKDPFYQQYTEHFVSAFEGDGGTILGTETFALGDRDMYTQITKILAMNPDAIFVPGYVEQAAFVYRQLRELQYEGPIYGFTGGSEEQFLAVATEEQMEGVYDLRPVEGTIEALGDVAKQYSANFETKYGRLPTPNAIYAYDTVYALKAGIEACGSVDDVLAITTALKNMAPTDTVALKYITVGGKWFDPNGQAYTSNIALKFTSGKWVVEGDLPADAETYSKYMSEKTAEHK